MELLFREERDRGKLGWAISLSTWIHLGLVALLLWLPLVQRAPELPKEDVVKFDMTPPKEPRKPEPKAFLRPPPAAARPVPPGPRAPAQTPQPPREAMPNTPEASGRTSSSPPAPVRQPRLPPGSKGSGQPGLSGDPPPGPREGPGGGGQFRLRDALQDFRRTFPPPGPPGGGGKGSGGSGGGKLEVPGVEPSGFGFGNLTFESRDYDWVPYATQVYYAIQRAWYSRLYAMSDVFERWAYGRGAWILDHKNQIRFTIERSGQISEVSVETESGCVPLDGSATDALREVVLPPLPADFEPAQEIVHVQFLAFGDIRNIRYDPQLRAAYYGQ